MDSYDCVVVSGPVWGGAPAPVLNGFIRQYQLEGKQTYGLLSCGLEGKSASKLLRAELEAAGTRCRSVITVKAENETLEALEKGKIEFLMRENGKIILQVSEKHRRKKNLTENQVQEMRELIEASETDDSVKKSASAPEKENVSPEGQTEEKTDNPKTQAAEAAGAHGDERPDGGTGPARARREGRKGDRSETEEPSVPAEKQAAEGDGAHGDEPRTEEPAQPAPAGGGKGPSKTEEPSAPAEKQAAEGDGAHGDAARTEEPSRPAPAGKKAEKGPSKTEEPPVPAEKQAAEGDGAHGDQPRTGEPVQPAPAGEKAGGRAPEGEQQEAGAMPKKIRKGRKRNEKQPSSDD